MSEEALYNKIDKFCNKTDWSKYPTYEHALEEFVKGIVAEETKELQEELRLEKIENKDLIERVNELEKENSELKEKLNFSTQYYQGEKAKEQLTEKDKQIEELEQTVKTLTRKFNQQSKLIEDYNTTLEKETKQIEELEKMLAEQYPDLKQSLDWANEREKNLETQIEQLEKENAELKADNVEWEKASDKWKNLYELTNNQLTTAKEIISEYINILKGDTKNWKKTQEKAEQFLKESE